MRRGSWRDGRGDFFVLRGDLFVQCGDLLVQSGNLFVWWWWRRRGGWGSVTYRRTRSQPEMMIELPRTKDVVLLDGFQGLDIRHPNRFLLCESLLRQDRGRIPHGEEQFWLFTFLMLARASQGQHRTVVASLTRDVPDVGYP